MRPFFPWFREEENSKDVWLAYYWCGSFKIASFSHRRQHLEPMVDTFGGIISFYSNHLRFFLPYLFLSTLSISCTDTSSRGGDTETKKGISSVGNN